MATASAASSFEVEGFTTTPIDVLSEAEAAACLQELDAYAARVPHGRITDEWRFQTHLFLPWVAERIVRNAALLRAVSAALGSEDLLAWFTEWHIKESSSQGRYTPHQDSTYAGLEPPDKALTAWVALTEADEENGAVTFYPRSHHAQLPHVEEPGDSTNLLLKGQRIPDEHLPEGGGGGGPVVVPLRPGQATLHAFRLVHASGPNRSRARRRVGLAVRFVTAEVRQMGRLREGAMLVSGRDVGQHFDLRPVPKEPWDAAGVALHRQEMATISVNYMSRSEKER